MTPQDKQTLLTLCRKYNLPELKTLEKKLLTSCGCGKPEYKESMCVDCYRTSFHNHIQCESCGRLVQDYYQTKCMDCWRGV